MDDKKQWSVSEVKERGDKQSRCTVREMCGSDRQGGGGRYRRVEASETVCGERGGEEHLSAQGRSRELRS